MEENHNKANRNLNFGSENSSIDLNSKLPDWLLGFFRPEIIGSASDIDKDLIEGYPRDDDF